VAIAGRYFLNLGGTIANVGAIRWGFRAPAKAYDNIGPSLGVTKVDDANRTGITYGVNQPRPARVRIAYVDASYDPTNPLSGDAAITGSATRFCEPDSLNDVLFGAINDKEIFVRGVAYAINNVTIK
jgi:hypothetical protein